MLKIAKKFNKLRFNPRRWQWQPPALILITAIIIVVGLIYIFNKPAAVEAGWYNDGWAYRQTVSVTNGGTAQTDFQVKIIEDVAALITAGKAQSDCDDIRITDISGNVLYHWIEGGTCNTTTADIWVKIPSIPTTATTLYLYYGNPSAVNVEDGSNVFQFFESFETLPGWTQSYDTNANPVDQGTWSVTSGELISDQSANQYRAFHSSYSLGSTFVTEFDIKFSTAVAGQHSGLSFYGQADAANNSYQWIIRPDTNQTRIQLRNSGSQSYMLYGDSLTLTLNQWYAAKLIYDGTNVTAYIDGVQEMTGALGDTTFTTGTLGMEAYKSKSYYDDLRVRKYTATEPVAGTPATEEKGPGPIAYWKFDDGYGGVATNSMPLVDWWDGDWKYRIEATVNTGYAPRLNNTVVERLIDFTTLGVSNIDTNSVRVVRDGVEVSSDVVRWFDTNTKAMVRWKMGGALNPKETDIQYYIYFDTTTNPKSPSSHTMPKEFAIHADSDTGPNAIWWAYNNYDGTFGSFTQINTGYQNSDVVIFDKDNDGDYDFAITHDNDGTHGLSVWQNNGSESFTKVETFDSDGNWNGVDIGDFNEDGYIDMISNYGMALAGGFNARIYLNDGDGTFTQQSSLGTCGSGTYGRRVAVGDYDGDKNMDFVAGGNGNGNDALCVYWGDGTGSFLAPTIISNSTSNNTDSHGMASADFNHDGYDDFAVHKDLRVFYYYQSQGSNRTFNNQTATHPGGTWPAIAATTSWTDLELWDVNKDGTLDLTGADWGSPYQAWVAFGTYRVAGGYPDSWGTTNASVHTGGVTTMEFTGPRKLQHSTNSISITLSDFEYNEHGIISGATWQTEDMCMSGKCLYFDGTNDYVNSGTGPKPTSAITMTAWVRPTVVDGAVHNVIDHHEGYEFQERDDANWRTYIKLSTSGWQTAICTSITVQPNQWYFVSGTYDSSTGLIKTYVDGEFCQSTGGFTGQTIAYTGTDETAIGGMNDATGRFFEGFIDEVKIYEYARSDAQIKADYLAGQSGAPSGVGASFGGGQQQADSEGLVGYWTMDETATPSLDSSGNGLSGTWVGTANDMVGKYGNAISLDGDSDYIDLGSNQTLATGASTVSLWFNSSEVIAGNLYNFIGDDGFTTNLAYFTIYQSKIAIWNKGGQEGAKWYYGDTTILPNTWYFVVLTSDGAGNYQVYLNGHEDSTWANMGTDDDNLVVRYIGRGSTSRFFKGKIDNVKIYNIARTADQIMKEYKTGPGPVAYYDFEEGSGVNLYDKSSNGYNSDSFGSDPAWTLGKVGSALDFDDNDYARNNSFSIGSDPVFTVTGWFKRTASTTSTGAWGIGAGGTGQQTISGYNGTGENIGIDSWGTSTYYVADTYPLNDWVYVTWVKNAATFTPTTIEIYVNGISKSLSTLRDGADAVTLTSGLTLGGIYPSSNYSAPMIIDDFKIYNYARNQEQILWDMNGDESPHPISHWMLDEKSGTTAVDIGPYGKNGSVSGSGTWTHGIMGGAHQFNSSRIDISGITSTPDNMSFSGWFKRTGANWSEAIAFLGKRSGTTGWMLYRNSGDTAGYFRWYQHYENAANTQIAYNSPDWPGISGMQLDTWHHIAVTRTVDGYSRTYLDGDLQSDFSPPSDFDEWAVNTNGISITAERSGGTSWIGNNMLMDDVKLFNFVLSPEQVRQEYNQGSQVSLGKQKDSTETWDAGGFGGVAPVGYWNFEEGSGSAVYDRSSNSNNGTIIGATYTLGKIGWGMEFDPTDEYVSIPYNAAFSPTTAVTVEAWVKMADPTLDRRIVSKTEGSGYTLGTTIDSVADQNFYVYRNGTYGKVGWNNSNFSSDTWYHMVGTYDGRYMKFYVNGDLKDTDDAGATYPIYQISNNLCIGIEAASPACTTTGDFDGVIDEVKIFNYARSQAQVSYDYNGGKPVGWWPLDDMEGTTAIDISGNGRAGTGFGTGSWEAGKYSNSYRNNGNHSGFELGAAQVLSDGSDATLSFWAKVNADFSNSYIGIFTAWGSSGPNTYWYGIRRDTGVTGWGMHYNDATSSANIMGATLTIGQWHHYSLIIDGTARRLYFDGEFIGEVTSGHTGWNDGARTSGTSGTMRTVGVTSYASYLTDHNTDDVRLYNYALTADQVKEVMNNGSVYIK